MINSEKINLNLKNVSGSKISEQELALRSKAVFEVWTYVDVVNFIETNFEEEFIKKELLSIAKKYPHSAYPVFIKNIQKTVSAILKNRSESLNSSFSNKQKLKPVEKNIQDMKQELSIEEQIKLEMENEKKIEVKQEIEVKENIESDDPPYGIKELEKEFE